MDCYVDHSNSYSFNLTGGGKVKLNKRIPNARVKIPNARLGLSCQESGGREEEARGLIAEVGHDPRLSPSAKFGHQHTKSKSITWSQTP